MILNIVMVEPEIPQNTGNVARTCAATGARLHLVGPMGFKIDDRKLKRAGLDYWSLLDITYYDSLEEFFEKNSGEFFFFSTKSVHKHTDVVYPDNCYLFFGKETAGLPEDLLFPIPRNTASNAAIFFNANRRTVTTDHLCTETIHPSLRTGGLTNSGGTGKDYRIITQLHTRAMDRYDLLMAEPALKGGTQKKLL